MEWLVTILVFSAVLNGALLLAWFARQEGVVEFRVLERSRGFDEVLLVKAGGKVVLDLDEMLKEENLGASESVAGEWWERGERPLGEPG